MAIPIKQFLFQLIPAEHAWKVTLFEQWHTLLGDWAQSVYIHKIERDQLIIAVPHPVWAHELRHLAPTIKQKINALFDQPRIRSITFLCIPRQVATGQTDHDSRQQKELHLTALTSQEIESLGPVKDSGLHSCMMQFFARCKTRTGGIS